MADLINLNKARKRRTRQIQEATAAANRIRFGRSKGEKRAEALAATAAAQKLDGLKRDPALPEAT